MWPPPCPRREFCLHGSNWQRYRNEGGTKLPSWLCFRYQNETKLLIPELVKIEAKRTLLFYTLERANWTDRSEAKSVYSTNLKERSRAKSVYSTNWTYRSEVKSVYSTNSKEQSKAKSVYSTNSKIEAEWTRFLPEIGKIKAKKTNWIEVKRTEAVF